MDFLPFKWVVLWSDWLVFLLLASLITFVFYVVKNPLIRSRWQQVFQSRIGSSAFIIILFYVAIAVLDSLHFRAALDNVTSPNSEPTSSESTIPETRQYSQTVDSVLDILLDGLRSQDEKTYSAPLAITSFAKETIQLDDGSLRREYPRLENAGSHLSNPDQHWHDVASKVLIAFGFGIFLSFMLCGGHYLWRHRAAQKNVEVSFLPWASIYGTLTFIICLTSILCYLGQSYHVFGTDKVGQDVLYQSIKAVRTGVLIGTLATLITLPLAVILGISAGYFKGRIDDLVQYIYTTLNSIPGILLIAASVLLIDVYIETHPDDFKLLTERADFKFLALCFILGMTSWTGLCRLLRAETLKVSQLEYVQAAQAFGVSSRGIIGRHILPNVTHIILIALVLDFSGFVLAEAVLSYIGVGVDPSMASWGNMINEARAELAREPFVWWSVSAAFFFMFVLVLAANLFSDRVRDAFDPRTPTVVNRNPSASKGVAS